MRRRTRIIYGITVALITAAGLQFTMGQRLHKMSYEYGQHRYDFYKYGAGGNFKCGQGIYDHWNKSKKNTLKVPPQTPQNPI